MDQGPLSARGHGRRRSSVGFDLWNQWAERGVLDDEHPLRRRTGPPDRVDRVMGVVRNLDPPWCSLRRRLRDAGIRCLAGVGRAVACSAAMDLQPVASSARHTASSNVLAPSDARTDLRALHDGRRVGSTNAEIRLAQRVASEALGREIEKMATGHPPLRRRARRRPSRARRHPSRSSPSRIGQGRGAPRNAPDEGRRHDPCHRRQHRHKRSIACALRSLRLHPLALDR